VRRARSDFVLSHVGVVERAVVDEHASLLVGTRQGVGAALNRSTGAILWRVVLPPSEGAVVALCANKDVVAIVSGAALRVFSRHDGSLLWDWLAEFAPQGWCGVLPSGDVVVGSPGKAEAFTKAKALWTLPIAVGDFLVTHEGGLYIASSTPSGHAVRTVVDAAVGRVTSTTTIRSGNAAVQVSPSAPVGFVSFDGNLVAQLESPTSVAVHDIAANQSVTMTLDVVALHSVSFTPGFIFARSQRNEAAAYNTQGKVVFKASSPIVRALGPTTAAATPAYFTVDEHATLEFYASTTAKEPAFRRDEALSLLTQVVSTVLPLRSAQQSLAAADASFAKRYSALMTHLATTLTGLLSAVLEQAESWVVAARSAARGEGWAMPGGGVQETSDEERARFGLARVFVGLSATGKALALHSETGAVLWQHAPGFVKPVLFKSRADPPEVLLLDAGAPRGIFLAADTGAVVATSNASCAKVLQSLVLPSKLIDNRAVIVLLCGDLSVRVLPDTAEANALVDAAAPYFYVAGERDVRGYALAAATVAAAKRTAYEAWAVVLPSSSTIVRVAAMTPDEVIGSPARALGDQTVLIKYINRHWISVASVDPETGLRLTSIDAVSGRTLHRLSHKDGAAPVNVVRFEHWLVASFWNAKSKRVEVSALTLYERALSRRAVNPWTAMPKGLLDDFDAFERTPASSGELISFQRTYALSGHEVTALGVTLTRRGIASKNLLVALGGTGQVVMIDQRLIDPRRTAQPPTPEETAEGLFQYAPELPIVPTNVLSYYRGAERVRLFHVAQAKLESTCHVLAVGLDVFKGRATPSGAFDLLAEDFAYALLFIMLVALVAGVIALRRMERKKALNDAWF